MEPDGRPLTPGSSCGAPPPSSSPRDDPAPVNCTLKSPCPSDSGDGPASAERPRGHEGADQGRSAQRRFKPSAFPSSLNWDSDSERETLDEEELQHFSNPHGLAAHSPGSPSSGLRLESDDEDDDDEAGERRGPRRESDPSTPMDGHGESAKTDVTKTPSAESGDGEARNASDGSRQCLSEAKPKEGCLTEEEADGGEGGKYPRKKERKDREKDVYAFTGDSDSESPPPAPWAHCTFIQRCRKKRVLLRPFSGLGATARALPESDARARESPQKSIEEAHPSRDDGAFDFEDFEKEAAAAEEAVRLKDGGADDDGERGGGQSKDIFTCVECSIYFKKKVHLQEHMIEHCQSDGEGAKRPGKGGRSRCDECGWSLPSRLALADHHKKHRDSRLKILWEIEKLNKTGHAKENHKVNNRSVVARVSSHDSTPTKGPNADVVTFPLLSPAPISSPDGDPVTLESEAIKTPPDSAQTPAQARAVPAYHRRYVCSKCNFSTRTSQALANHTKTHKRKRPGLKAASSPSDSRSCSASTSLACGLCAFLTSSHTLLKEHQNLVHPVQASVGGGAQVDETGRRSASDAVSQSPNPPPDSRHPSASGSLPGAARGKSHQGIPGAEDGTRSDIEASRPASQARFTSARSRKFGGRDEAWADPIECPGGPADDNLPGSEEERDGNAEIEMSREDSASPPGARKQRASVGTNSDATPALASQQGDKQDAKGDGKVFFLRRSTRVSAAYAEVDSESDDELDEERMRLLLSEGLSDEEDDEMSEEAGAQKSVERKCPYCPDRFHNGIGLANHVRGHLNRVGVSYNVRHFISPEEVNAIERKVSYQKKKKKVANFDPDTFSVMHCEFCSAGFDTRAGLSSHARAHLRDFGITNWDVTISPIHILRELFSSRPDLIVSAAAAAAAAGPPRSPGSGRDEDEDEEEEERDFEEVVKVKLEGETSERTLGAAVSDAQTPTSGQEDGGAREREGEEGEASPEGDEEELRRRPDALRSRPRETAPRGVDPGGLSPGEDADSEGHDLKCELCGAEFESRQGMSSHARSHLRQLSVNVTESSHGPPVDFLYQIAKDRGQDSSSTPEARPAKTSPHFASPKDEDLIDMDLDEKPISLPVLAKPAPSSPSSMPTRSPGASPAPKHSGSPSSVVRKAPICSLLPVSSPLRCTELKAGGMKSLTSHLSPPSALAPAKPIWAPQETDAPLNLTLEVDPNKDIVCQLCGAWFETRKGLSSHARAHLRHFGVEYSESKGSPIDLLNQLIDTDDFKHKARAMQLDGHAENRGLVTPLPSSKQPLLSFSSPSSPSLLYKVTTSGGGSTSKATSSSSFGPPAKRFKSSSMQVFRLSSGELMALPHSEPPKEIGCEFCGEYFENRKGLSSHARSHLRQMGITEWSVNGSPIDTLREIITRRGLPCALSVKPLKTPPPSSPGPPRSPLSAPSSPSTNLLGRLPFAFARPPSPRQPAASKSGSAPPASSGGLILKLKPEPEQLEVTLPGAVGRSGGFSSEPLNCSWTSSDNVFPLNLAMAHDAEPTRDIRCEFCGEYFENRKGLSSHARSHLRQMGITQWSVNGSPIDTLREVIRKRRPGGVSSQSAHGVKKESSQGAGSPLWENTAGVGGSEGLCISGYQSSKFRKSPLSLLPSGSRLHKPGLGSPGSSAAPSGGRIIRISSLGKRPRPDEAQSADAGHLSPHQLKTFSPLPHDFSVKKKSSLEKPPHRDPSCELCGFYFENRKALASHARAHLRQFGVTEWCVNGSPIETLSAWMRSRPQKVLEMHRSYMQGNRSTLKKKSSSPFSAPLDFEQSLPVSSQRASSSSSQWSPSLAVSLARAQSRDVGRGSFKAAGVEDAADQRARHVRPGRTSPSPSRLPRTLPLQAQVARSELNVRLPRGFERRPVKHPSCADGAERDSGPPKPPRTGTVPALVPKPPTYPLVKLVGKFYTLKCRFCEVEFHGPLSVQEDWIRHLQQHILKMNYDKPAAPKAANAEPRAAAVDRPALAQTSTATSSSSSSTKPAVASAPPRPTPPHSCSPAPLAESAPPGAATEIVKVPEEQLPLTAVHIPLPTQTA